MNNGKTLRDVSTIGDDHMNEVDLNDIQQIEIVRGPSSLLYSCLLYTSPSPRDATLSRMPSSA